MSVSDPEHDGLLGGEAGRPRGSVPEVAGPVLLLFSVYVSRWIFATGPGYLPGYSLWYSRAPVRGVGAAYVPIQVPDSPTPPLALCMHMLAGALALVSGVLTLDGWAAGKLAARAGKLYLLAGTVSVLALRVAGEPVVGFLNLVAGPDLLAGLYMDSCALVWLGLVAAAGYFGLVRADADRELRFRLSSLAVLASSVAQRFLSTVLLVPAVMVLRCAECMFRSGQPPWRAHWADPSWPRSVLALVVAGTTEPDKLPAPRVLSMDGIGEAEGVVSGLSGLGCLLLVLIVSIQPPVVEQARHMRLVSVFSRAAGRVQFVTRHANRSWAAIRARLGSEELSLGMSIGLPELGLLSLAAAVALLALLAVSLLLWWLPGLIGMLLSYCVYGYTMLAVGGGCVFLVLPIYVGQATVAAGHSYLVAGLAIMLGEMAAFVAIFVAGMCIAPLLNHVGLCVLPAVAHVCTCGLAFKTSLDDSDSSDATDADDYSRVDHESA